MSPTPREKQNARSQTASGSSDSVRVFWLDRSKTIAKLRTAAERMTRQFSEVQRVILFGSLSRGDAVPGSDADLLVILRSSDLPFHDRSARYRFEGLGIGADVFAYTQVEVDAMLAEGNAFLSEALETRMSIFLPAPHARARAGRAKEEARVTFASAPIADLVYICSPDPFGFASAPSATKRSRIASAKRFSRAVAPGPRRSARLARPR